MSLRHKTFCQYKSFQLLTRMNRRLCEKLWSGLSHTGPCRPLYWKLVYFTSFYGGRERWNNSTNTNCGESRPWDLKEAKLHRFSVSKKHSTALSREFGNTPWSSRPQPLSRCDILQKRDHEKNKRNTKQNLLRYLRFIYVRTTVFSECTIFHT